MYSNAAPWKILKHNLILLAAVIILFFLNQYHHTIFFRPGSIHQWRQTDCLSITKNYYEEGMHFFQPKIHYQGVPGGKTVSECPILNYTGAALWKLFGEHEFIYRLMEYFIFMVALFTLFNTLLWYFKSPVLSYFTAGLVLTSPLIVYYSPNFIADVPALSFAIISFCIFFHFYHSKRTRHFYIALLAGTIAVLLKASALISITVILFFSLVDLLRLNGLFRIQRLFEKKIFPAAALLISVIVVFGWYRFALAYNNNDSDDVFLLTVLPIWDMERAEQLASMKVLFNDFFPLFLNKPMFFLFLCLVVYVISKFRQLDSFFKYTFVFSAIFFVAYILFFFRVFQYHDYYLVNLMIFPVITLMAFISHMSRTRFLIDNGRFAVILISCILAGNAVHAAAVYRLRTIFNDRMVAAYPFISEEESKLAAYNFWEYSRAIQKVEDITPALRDAGIKRSDHVLSIPDGSFDISLYLMDQKGFTIARDHIEHDSTVLDRFIPKVKYIVLSDTVVKKETAYRRMAHKFEPLFKRGPVEVLKVRK